jgi:hypothetical protein
MDFPVSEDFVQTANPLQLAEEAKGESSEWPAAFYKLEDGSWVYRIEDVEDYVEDDEEGNPIDKSRPRDGVLLDAELVSTALSNHVPNVLPTQSKLQMIANLLSVDEEELVEAIQSALST